MKLLVVRSNTAHPQAIPVTNVDSAMGLTALLRRPDPAEGCPMTSDNSDRIEHSTLIVYASAAGSTAQIAEFMAQRMRDKQLHVRVEPVDRAPDPGLFEAVVLGSAIHNGRFLPGFADYIQRHAATLKQQPNWLFSVGMGPALHGPVGAIFKRITPPAVTECRTAADSKGYQGFAGVVARPPDLRTRLLVRLFGCPFGDLRDWTAIAAWIDGITGWIDDNLPATRFPATGNLGE
ncbi:flavodoxin [Nocardia seriolae]|uniref:flavodoxin domain-containing protein n=1 Tax=Nocardia seriolae TaxID=37332 RepID=UPI001160B2E1|nr:flavodoxin domain-containing protein [Nocardia seriolae]MTJ65595.1 flavodoxin [Nocardia seriolae]MTJ72758.1 flavodoxin [Nocardia seriolae]MTJ90472.1 flavodoxin [Nocardia seriolae]MTK34432.1 flavodoxin [Nocardia seriolae]MTK43586.1 flavodoxin [Nocardia seriolae]